MDVVQGPDSSRSEWLCRIVKEYEKDIMRMCLAYLRDYALAQDAAQETFLKAYRGYDAFRGDCSEKTWLMRIAVNVCKDIRRSAWYRYVDRRVTFDMIPRASEPPSEEHTELTSAIMRLPPKYMEAVLLYYYQNMNVREIAQALGITPSAVSLRLNKARKRLHGYLKGGEDYEA